MLLRSFVRSTTTWTCSSSVPRRFARSYAISNKSPPFPTISTCPSPTCACAARPDGLDIDYSKPLNGTMAPYAQQVLICTGKDDWSSRIEEENGGQNLAASIKGLLGRGGTYSDPYHNVAVANTSFSSSTDNAESVYLLPSFKYVPDTSGNVEALVRGYLLPTQLNPAHESLSSKNRSTLLRDASQTSILEADDVKDILVLICGHGGRDMRCGITGPILRDTFKTMLPHKNIVIQDGVSPEGLTAKIGLISHIGGHKFAGNIILYIPPHMKVGQESHPLAGCGIWYGRVEPKHVEGIIQETILGGRVIKEFFRGGIKQDGEILRL